MTINERFEKLFSKYISVIGHNLKKRIDKAKDKEYVFNEIKKEMASVNAMVVAIPEFKRMTETFADYYKRGENMDDIFRFLSEVYGDAAPMLVQVLDEKGNEIKFEISDEEKELKKLASDQKKLMKFLVRYAVYQEIEKKLPELFSGETKQGGNSNTSYPIQWTGNRDNKNDFVQLIYALHQAGYLNKGKGEITKIVETLADILKVGLGKNWQSNLSSSVHKSKRDYQPPVFDKVKQAYLRYADELVTAKKMNK